ncbi:MAG: putative acyltransferase [Chthoniobacteraceae bacterium]|nr:putative acyltransferase [Chthoniobacteraceae bacterium]
MVAVSVTDKLKSVPGIAVHKRQDIEALRIASAFAIVWYHSGISGHEVSYGGLIVFLILSVYLAGHSARPINLRIFQRAQRLLIPWVIWFVVYGVFNVIKHKPIISLGNGALAGVLAGSSIHLWYMPYIFVWLILFDFSRTKLPDSLISWVSGILAAVMLSLTVVWRAELVHLGYPFTQYLHGLAGIFLGSFFAGWNALHRKARMLLLTIIVLSAVSAIPYEGVGIPYLIGIAAGCILVFKPFDKAININLDLISQCTLGVYFVHVLLLAFIRKFGVDHNTLLPVAGFILSVAIVFLMRRSFPRLAKYWI